MVNLKSLMRRAQRNSYQLQVGVFKEKPRALHWDNRKGTLKARPCPPKAPTCTQASQVQRRVPKGKGNGRKEGLFWFPVERGTVHRGGRSIKQLVLVTVHTDGVSSIQLLLLIQSVVPTRGSVSPVLRKNHPSLVKKPHTLTKVLPHLQLGISKSS